jgi:hypothetical protein
MWKIGTLSEDQFPSHAYLFQLDASNVFTVILSGNQLDVSVRFFLVGEIISVKVDGQVWDATVTLQDAGDGVFKLGKEEVGFWPISQKSPGKAVLYRRSAKSNLSMTGTHIQRTTPPLLSPPYL